MRKVAAEAKARKAKRRLEVEESRETKQVNEDAKTIPCQYCGRTAVEVMEAKSLKPEQDQGLGFFDTNDGKTIFVCSDCGWEKFEQKRNAAV